MSKWHGGKGSSPRPLVDTDAYTKNWDRIFNGEYSDDQLSDNPCEEINDSVENDEKKVD